MIQGNDVIHKGKYFWREFILFSTYIPIGLLKFQLRALVG